MEVRNGKLISIESKDIKNGILNLGNDVEVVGDHFDISSFEIIKIIAPSLKTIGNYSFSSNNSFTGGEFPSLTTIGNDSFRSNNSFTSLKTKKHTLVNSNDELFIIENPIINKGITIYSGYKFMNMRNNEFEKGEKCYVVEKHGTFQTIWENFIIFVEIKKINYGSFSRWNIKDWKDNIVIQNLNKC